MFPLVAEGGVVTTTAATALDIERMRSLIAFTMKTMDTPHPVPYGAEIFDSRTGVSLMRGLNRVGEDHDPSAHGEIVTIRQACAKLQSWSLKGYTLYTTCEPCPMCMTCCVWAGLDRVVYGATIADAAQFGHQIMIPSVEVAKRTDLKCAVTGPVERDLALKLFTNSKMQALMKTGK
jgi:tRNA(Arg) A34 adenosine deaminase TadA